MLANAKPWGFEYLAYQNKDIAIWHLILDPWQETSLHCHPNKKTGLIVLDGAAYTSFLSGGEKLFASDKVMIRQGVFHSTKNMTKYHLELLEVETPVNKSDIVRVRDKYGRANTPYTQEPKVTVNFPLILTQKYVRHGSCSLALKVLNREIPASELNSNYIIVSGGVYADILPVVSPGDIISGFNLNNLINEFYLKENTEVIRVFNEHR